MPLYYSLASGGICGSHAREGPEGGLVGVVCWAAYSRAHVRDLVWHCRGSRARAVQYHEYVGRMGGVCLRVSFFL